MEQLWSLGLTAIVFEIPLLCDHGEHLPSLDVSFLLLVMEIMGSDFEDYQKNKVN